MRLFHVSEEGDIAVFHPRLPARKDLDPHVGLVWAIDEQHLCNFLTPRNCPRVCAHAWTGAAEEDVKRLLSGDHTCMVALEEIWRDAMMHTMLYLYEFDPANFVLQDESAGYYVSNCTEKPIRRHVVENPLAELLSRGADVRFVPNIWPLADRVKQSTLQWSLCRMGYAQPRECSGLTADDFAGERLLMRG